LPEISNPVSLSRGKEEIVYNKILVPLDGSELAECIFPHLETLAGGCQAKEVVLIRVIEPFRQPTPSEYIIRPEEIIRINQEVKAEAEKYISQASTKIKRDGFRVKTEVLAGSPAEFLSDYATKNGIDLIVIATHGRSGVSRWVWGSVADRILRSACVPVLMVRAPGCVPGI
jgi:nucleotide-binding universal stress UspA family protein